MISCSHWGMFPLPFTYAWQRLNFGPYLPLLALLLLAAPAYAHEPAAPPAAAQSEYNWFMVTSIKPNASLYSAYPTEAKCKEAKAAVMKASKAVSAVCLPILR